MMKTLSVVYKKNQLIEVILYTSAFAAILWAIYFSVVTITIPYQVEFREGTAQVMTEILLEGGNPFVFDNQPLAMNNYGLGYNLTVMPFAVLFGNTLAVHRAVTLFFILLSALLEFIVVQKNSGSTSFALACAAFVMIGLVGYGGAGAFPSSVGTFLFLLALLVPFLRSFDWISLFVSLLSSLFAFYTKPYFLLAFGIVCSYLFLFGSKKKGILYGVIFLVMFAGSLLVVSRLFPLYFVDTFIGNASNTNLQIQHLTIQLGILFLFFYPVLILSILVFGMRFFNERSQNIRQNNQLNVLSWNSPFVNHSFNFLLYTFLCSLFVFVLVLGQHIGNYLNYAFQLLVPTFFCWFLIEAAQMHKLKFILVFGIVVNLFTWELKTLDPAMLAQKNSVEWTHVYEYLHASSFTLNSPATASGVLALGQTPIDSGQTAYYYEVEPFTRNPFNRISYADFHEDGFLYTKLVDRMIEKQRFDLVITTKEKANFYHDGLLNKYYQQVDEIKVDMPQTSQIWTLVFWKPIVK